MQTRHAEIRARQGAFSPIAYWLLDEFGEEEHDGHGSIRVFFSRRSVRKMEQALGRQSVGLFKRFLRAYKIESCRNGAVITKGWQTRHMNRR